MKIPNLSELAGKADVAGVLNKVKSMINSATAGSASDQLAEANEETLRAKMVEVEDVIKQAKDVQNQQAKLIASLENKLSELAAIVVAIKAPPKSAAANAATEPVAPVVESLVTTSTPSSQSESATENPENK